MVECESNKLGIGADAYSVLIDTWWNVNAAKPTKYYSFDIVLIDTWWNVNTDFYPQEQLMMIVLIDTWWNVNFEVLLLH